MLSICGKMGALLALAILFTACREEKPVIDRTCRQDMERLATLWTEGKDCNRLLQIDSACRERVVAIRSIVGADTLEKLFVLRDSASYAAGAKLPAELSRATVLRTPLQRVVALSSAQIGYMLRLGLEDRIVAVGDGKYIADSTLYVKVTGGKIAEVGNGTSLDFEKLMALKPDLVMTFATGGSQDDYSRLEALGLPAMLTSEWQEDLPMVKAEWLKLYGALFERGTLADTLLGEMNRKMESYGRNIQEAEPCTGPRVLAGMSYGGVWYAPGGRSYTANLIRASGGCYLWASDTTREMRLTIEDVIALADSVDVWVHPGMLGTAEEILAAEPRASHIKAFKDKHVFQNDGRKGPGGGNDFYEGAVARPAELIQNLRSLILENPGLSGADSGDGLNQGQSVALPFQWYHNIF